MFSQLRRKGSAEYADKKLWYSTWIVNESPSTLLRFRRDSGRNRVARDSGPILEAMEHMTVQESERAEQILHDHEDKALAA
jgi:hypothetical protein